jgi:hypothetical protein
MGARSRVDSGKWAGVWSLRLFLVHEQRPLHAGPARDGYNVH